MNYNVSSCKTCALFGHRKYVRLDQNELYMAVLELVKSGVSTFYVGTHGDFDALAYSTLVKIKRQFDIKIFLVFTNAQIFKTDNGVKINDIYPDAECISFEVEQLHFKQRIIETNKYIVNKSDIVLCYVNLNEITSGARRAILYAMHKNLPVINLFK